MAKYVVLYPVSIKDSNGVDTLHSKYGTEIEVNKNQNDVDKLVADGFLRAVEVEVTDPDREEPADQSTEAGARQMTEGSEPSEAGQSGETRAEDADKPAEEPAEEPAGEHEQTAGTTGKPKSKARNR